MKLNEFIGTDTPDSKLSVGATIIEEMIERESEVDTGAFLYVYRQLTKHTLPAIAAERALTRDWELHPMFGIDSPKCQDQRAQEYQSISRLSDKVFDLLQGRAVFG